MKTFFGFAVADSMFPAECVIRKERITIEEIRNMLNNLIPCINPSHQATIDVMKAKYGIDIPIPERAPLVSLEGGDKIIVMGVRGLPRREGRTEYTKEEIDNAEFVFSVYTVE